MFCDKCGNKIQPLSKFCNKCGQNVELTTLQKTFNTTGNLSIILAIVGFVSAMVVGYKPEHIITDTIVALVFAFPRLYFGIKLKSKGVHNLKYALKISLGMFIYSLIIAIINFIFGPSGWLYYILIYFYFKSYKRTKSALA